MAHEAKYDLTYQSNGMGVQSCAMLVCSALGLHGVPRFDASVFCDLGAEPQYIYDQLGIMEKWAKAHGIEFVRLDVGSLEANLLRTQMARVSGFQVSVPAYSGSDPRGGMLRRQCTAHYKIEPLRRWARERLGYAKGEIIKGKALVRSCIGISVDEVWRMKPSGDAWIDHAYPLIDARLNRNDCIKIVEKAGLPRPGKSSCVFCPYHSNAYWEEMRVRHPGDFARAVAVDESIRDSSAYKVNGACFLHRSRLPLKRVCFTDPNQVDLFDGFINECEGVCGV